MFERFTSWIRSVASKMFGKTVYNRAKLPVTIITDDMAAAIDHWINLYYNRAPWLTNNSLSLGLPSAIAREIATLVTLEAKINITAAPEATAEGEEKTEPGMNPRAEFIAETLKPLLSQLPIRTEYACAFGGIAFKPYPDGDKIAIDCVNADNFYPTTFNSRGEITGAIFIEKKKSGNDTFIRVEHHEMVDNTCTITNRAYRSFSDSDLGTEIDLAQVDEWADIQPEVTIANVESPLFAYFKIPQGNVVDVDSQLGVSVYARAERAGVLEEADKQWQRLSWEYEGGEMAIDASSDTFKMKDGLPVLPAGKERLFRTNELDSNSSTKGVFETFNPTLRDASYASGLNKVLMRVEDLCGIARGTYSDPNAEVRTATELKVSKQRTYATISSIQMSLQDALEKLAKACDTLATLYNLVPAGNYVMSFAWDDSILIDAEAERERDRQDVRDGFMNKWEYRVKWFGETPEKAKQMLSEMQEDEGLTEEELFGFMNEPGSKKKKKEPEKPKEDEDEDE